MAAGRDHALPFTAIVGQEDLKLALLLNVVNPRIGGLLVRGPKGTGKSTAVHSLARLLPEREEVADCPWHCVAADPEFLCDRCRDRIAGGETVPLAARRMRVVPLPLSVGEDRLVGSIDVERMLTAGEKAFQPGVLADANRNFLYVDEINLLPDHVADDLLDAAALGVNTVEREGFSVSHPARFLLVGTMNPEEGDLRPQLLDRLPLSVNLSTLTDPDQRMEIVRRNLRLEHDAAGLRADFADEEAALAARIGEARRRLPAAAIEAWQLRAIAATCIDLKVDGHRPDIVITRTAVTLAAIRGRTTAEREDLLDASRFALGHRTRDGGFEAPATAEEIEASLDRALAAGTSRSADHERIGLVPAEDDPGVKKKS